MKIFLDFDDCLVDTLGGVIERMKDVAEKHGVGRDVFSRTLREHFSGAKSDGGKTYHPDDHACILFPDDERLAKQLSADVFEAISDIRDVVFSDVIDFLRSFREGEVFLLTYGNADFQSFKVEASGLGRYFQEVIVTDEHKMDVIVEKLKQWGVADDEPVFFIDDRSLHFSGQNEAMERVQCIHLKRPGKDFFAETCDDRHTDVDSLESARKLIVHS